MFSLLFFYTERLKGTMKPEWKDEDIARVLGEMGKARPGEAVLEQVGSRIRDRIESRTGHRRHLAWRPWGHPVRWVAAAFFLSLAFAGVFQHEEAVDANETASYLMSVSDPAEGIPGDLGLVHVSILLSGPAVGPGIKAADDHMDILAGDEILL
jgi:hypothetical protein